MRTIIFLIAFLLCGSLLAQCPGGQCQRPLAAPAKVTKSVLKTTTTVVQKATVRESRRVQKFRLFKRWR